MSNTTKKIALQILLFGGIWLLIPLIFNDLDIDSYNFHRGSKILVGVTVIILVNTLWLLPNFYFKNKVGLYILLGILLIATLYYSIETFLDPLLETLREDRPRRPRRGGGNRHATYFSRELNNMMPYLLAFVGSALFEISSFANRKTKEAILLKSEKLETEMKLLKSQINPHFLFNALNNIYSLSYFVDKYNLLENQKTNFPKHQKLRVTRNKVLLRRHLSYISF